MIAENKIMLLKRVESLIDIDNPQTILIEDKEDVDMYFTFQLTFDSADNTCYTRYKVNDSAHGIIEIVNAASDASIQVPDKIDMGTYLKKYTLLMSYILHPEDEKKVRKLIVEFWIKDI